MNQHFKKYYQLPYISNNHKFNKFSQFSHTNCCEIYLSKKDIEGRKWTKLRNCKLFGISRTWFDNILTRFQSDESGQVLAMSRINSRYQTDEYKAS
jgi:hypothetical protein